MKNHARQTDNMKCSSDCCGGTNLQSMGGKSSPCCQDPISAKVLCIACIQRQNGPHARALPHLQICRSYSTARDKHKLAKAAICIAN